jgi:hypothetical protein
MDNDPFRTQRDVGLAVVAVVSALSIGADRSRWSARWR